MGVDADVSQQPIGQIITMFLSWLMQSYGQTIPLPHTSEEGRFVCLSEVCYLHALPSFGSTQYTWGYSYWPNDRT
jgi:hypothetical protein